MNLRRMLQKKIHPEQKYCPRCGWLMTFPHDGCYSEGYDINTGQEMSHPYKIHSTRLQYCIKDNLFLQKSDKGEWDMHYDLFKILHLI